MSNQNISDEFLNAFVDNQLDSAEKIQAFENINKNALLKDRVCELSGLKEMMQHAYKTPPSYTRARIRPIYSRNKLAQSLAASILLLIGGASGWLVHDWTRTQTNTDINGVIQAQQANDSFADTRKVIVHIGTANPMKLKALLDETENLLESYKQTHRKIQVEVIANKQGVNLLRTNLTHDEKRISTMHNRYPNLKFMVCGQTIRKLRDQGENINLLPHTEITPSAAEQINKRLEQGWGYVRI